MLEAVHNLHFEDDVFLNVVMRSFEDLHEEDNFEPEILQDINEDDFDLIYNGDYEFENLE